MSAGIIQGNIASITLLTAVVDLGSVAANTTEEETATVPGVKVGDFVLVSKPTLEAGLLLGTCRVSANDTVLIQVDNPTGSAINAASETLTFLVFRPEALEVKRVIT